jgi:ubiquinone/menaquinone biosynthesis C-methylase UbiE
VSRKDRPIRHPIFAAVYDRMMAGAEASFLPEHRDALADGASGSVLDLGVGTGTMLDRLARPGVVLYGIEPDPHMLERAARKVANSGVVTHLCRAPAERIPFANMSFDVVVSSLVLCTVRDVSLVLSEAARVLKPGGEFRFFEHVRSDGAFGRFQDVSSPLWRRLAAGCNLNRRTDECIRASALEMVYAETFETSAFPVRTFVRGCAVRPE